MTLIEELKQRELFFASTNDNIENYLENNKVVFYLGCDPTGNSLHVGHLVTYLVAKRLAEHGHTPILLIGGATGLIGDPKMQGERKMLTLETVKENAECLKKQVKGIFGFENIVNNYDWTSSLTIIDFLRLYGKEFNVNYMIAKDTVKSRLEKGISYTEFSYQILQAMDWYVLFKDKNCQMQIGGQDQWGNMTAGTDLIRKKCGDVDVMAFTIPLILKSDGTKFGKSEGGKSVWLDKNRTSSYEFYQFWINTPDEEVIKRLKQFTFLTLEEISKIEKQFNLHREDRLAQKVLAKEMTTFIHGEAECKKAIKISEALFSSKIKELTADEIKIGFKDLPCCSGNKPLIDILIELQLASSKREAREFISSGAVYLNDEKINDINLVLDKTLAIEGKVIVIRRGKKKYGLVSFE